LLNDRIALLNDCKELFEPHPVPEWVTNICADFGHSESGLPFYRVVWNPDRTRVMACMDLDTNGRKQRTIRKYPRLGYRWIVEVLLPWEKYGSWYEEFFGPKPQDGEYCHTHTIQWNLTQMMHAPASEETDYMSLEDFGADSLRLLLTTIEHNKAIQAWQLRQYDTQVIEDEEKEWKKRFDDVYDDNMGELAELEKAADKAGVVTSLDPLPKQIEKERRAKAKQQGKTLIH
jgi:hypothetical protein